MKGIISRWWPKRTESYRSALLCILLAVILVTAGCGAPGDPIVDNLYTQNVYPGTASTYSIGSEDYPYLEGWFDAVNTDNLTAGGIFSDGGIFSEGDIYSEGTIYIWDGAAWQPVGFSTGNVTAAAMLTDHAIIRGDGGGYGVQDSGPTIDDVGALDMNGSDFRGEDVYAGNSLYVTNDLEVTDDVEIGGTLDMTAGQIVNLLDPTLAQDAATKNYVDTAGGGGSVGGLYGINVETLAGAKTLTVDTDEIYQYLDEGGANRIITLDTASASAGDRWIIRHNGDREDTHYLDIKQAATRLDMIYAGVIKEFIFDGTNWMSGENGTGGHDSGTYGMFNVGIGYSAKDYTEGTSVGYASHGSIYGAAVGKQANGYSYGVAVGYVANGSVRGVAIGYRANTGTKRYSTALGYFSVCVRTGETSININGDDSDQENNVVQGRWEKATANNTPIEMFCGGQASQRFTIRASSVLAFTMIITARDNVAGHVAMWTVADGCIKRDAAGNTTLLSATVVEVQDESTDWTVAVTADDTNEALIITVTGDATNATQFAAVMNGVETHF